MVFEQEEGTDTSLNRRPIAQIFRQLAHGAVSWCAKYKIHPNTISWMSIVPAITAGVCFLAASQAPGLWLVGAALCLVRLWFNMLDGMVAIATNQCTRSGKIVNEIPDRVSDLVVFVGLAHFGSSTWLAGYWAGIMALMTAYMGIIGQTVGAPREFGGFMAKPWRMVVVVVVAVTNFIGHYASGIDSDNFSQWVVQLGCWIVVLGCIQTIWVRYGRTMRWLQRVDGTMP